MGAILAIIARALASAAIFQVFDALIERVFDKDEETIIDETGAAVIAGGYFSMQTWRSLMNQAKNIPIPPNVSTANEAADYLTTIYKNKEGLTALNAKLGGFAPLAIKLAEKTSKFLTKRNFILVGGALLFWKFIVWLMYLPNLIQQFGDQIAFAPEQIQAVANKLGLNIEIPISEARQTQRGNQKTSGHIWTPPPFE